MPVVLLRPRALDDLAERWAYIAGTSEQQADAFANLIDRKFNSLARRPTIGRLRPELIPDLRSFPAGRYVIFYFPITNGIEVVRVLHGARDLDADLFDDVGPASE